MSITVTPYLRPDKINPKNDNETSVHLRIQMDGVRYLRSVNGYYASDEQWDVDEKRMKVKASKKVKLHEQAKQINLEIERLRNGMLDRYHKHDLNSPGVPADPAVIIDDKASMNGQGHALKTDEDIFVFVEQKIKDFAERNVPEGTLKVYRTILNNLENFIGSRKMSFSQINITWLNKYLQAMYRNKYAANTMYQNFTKLKWFCGEFAKDNLLVKFDPFFGFKIPEVKAGDTEAKDRLTIEELDLFVDYAETGVEEDVMIKCGKKRLDGTYPMKVAPKGGKKIAAIYFLLGCYTGLRHSDWGTFDLKKHVIEEDGERYITNLRALKNGEIVTVPVHSRLERLLKLIEQYPVAPEYDTASDNLKELTKELGINKKITTHVGRKTFAVTVCADNDIAVETCATMMGIHIMTCIRSYYEVTMKKISRDTKRGWANL